MAALLNSLAGRRKRFECRTPRKQTMVAVRGNQPWWLEPVHPNAETTREFELKLMSLWEEILRISDIRPKKSFVEKMLWAVQQ